jgi:anti-sigma factor RsiW
VDDATMLRLLDRVAGAPERARAEAHLRVCDACAGAYAELRDGSARVRAALDEAFGDLPSRPWRRRAGAAARRRSGVWHGARRPSSPWARARSRR